MRQSEAFLREGAPKQPKNLEGWRMEEGDSSNEEVPSSLSVIQNKKSHLRALEERIEELKFSVSLSADISVQDMLGAPEQVLTEVESAITRKMMETGCSLTEVRKALKKSGWLPARLDPKKTKAC